MGRPRKRMNRTMINATESIEGESERGNAGGSSRHNENQEVPSNNDRTSQQNQADLEPDIASQPRKRGKTTMNGIWRQPTNERIVISCNGFGQPVGPGATELTNFCGVVARNPSLCPLSYDNWKAVPSTTKGEAISMIKNYFSFPETLDKWVQKSLGIKWKDFKGFLKGKYYFREKSEEENARNVPKDVSPQDWHYLVKYWKSDKGKKKEEIGKRSRGLQKVSHTTGSKSFAILRDEMEKESSGQPIGELDFYEATHTSKNGSFVDDSIEDIIRKGKELISERLDNSESDNVSLQQQIMSELRGPERHGRVRGLGLGPTPTQVFGSSQYTDTNTRSTNSEVSALRMEVDVLKQQVAILLNRLERRNDSYHSQDGQTMPTVSSHANNEERDTHN